MIVNTTQKGWEIIFQRAHGLLALQLAQFWKKNQRPERWIEMLSAILEHDNGQENAHERYHLTDAGAPKDFKLQEFSLEQAKRVTQSAIFQSGFIGLLISKHISFLYESFRGNDKETDTFLDEQKELQKETIKRLKISAQEVENSYSLLQWCDRCSLILSKNELPDDERKLEIFKGPDGKEYFIIKRKDETIQVMPWPFKESDFKVWVEYRQVDKMVFKNDLELFSYLNTAPVKLKEWHFIK